MMKVLEKLKKNWAGTDTPFLIQNNDNLKFSDLDQKSHFEKNKIQQGDVVALIGDFNIQTISTLLHLIDMNVIVVPLTKETRYQHEYFFEVALVDVIIENNHLKKVVHNKKNKLIDTLRNKKRAGLILFSTGTTGLPKAILHDFTMFLEKFETPRPSLRALSFLLFDHIGGINTLLHILFNKGVIIAPSSRKIPDLLNLCHEHQVEVLPATPTFLRMMLFSGFVPNQIPNCIKIITYGTEKMDQHTLTELCKLLPNIDFRQTFGMSELGILRVKSKSRDSLFMKIGGEGIETKVVEKVLYIRTKTPMLGYLNADSPFDKDDWYNTNDIVETDGDFYKVVGRKTDVINVGGLKFMASEVELIALNFPDIQLVKAYARSNPITGQHVEIMVQSSKNISIKNFKSFLKNKLPSHMLPKKIIIGKIEVNHRYKKS